MKRFAAIFTAILLITGCFHTASADDFDFSYGNSYYEFIISDCTWSEAFQYAQNSGGHLVRFDTPDEYYSVLERIEELGLQWKMFWIGARRDLDYYDYYWVDDLNNLTGDCLNDFYNWINDEWMAGEPSFEDSGRPEWCVDMFYYAAEGRWVLNDTPNDIISVVPSFSGKLGYIIEYGDNSSSNWGGSYDYVNTYDDYDDSYFNSYDDTYDYNWSPGWNDTGSQSGSSLPYFPENFTYSSGAGAWSTELYMQDDGSFTGRYHDSDMGSDTDYYPGGVYYESDFYGSFTNFNEVDNYTWLMDLSYLSYDVEPGYDYSDGYTHHITTEAYGIADGDVFYLYLPGHPASTLPGEFWNETNLFSNDQYGPCLDYYAIYNPNTGSIFVSY